MSDAGVWVCIVVFLACLVAMWAGGIYMVVKDDKSKCDPQPEPGYAFTFYSLVNPEEVMVGLRPRTAKHGPHIKAKGSDDDSNAGLQLDKMILPDIPLWTAVSRNQIDIDTLTGHGFRTPFSVVSAYNLLYGYDDYLPCMALGELPTKCKEIKDRKPFQMANGTELNWSTFNAAFPGCTCVWPFLSQYTPKTFVGDRATWNPQEMDELNHHERKSCDSNSAMLMHVYCTPSSKHGDMFSTSVCWKTTDIQAKEHDIAVASPCLVETDEKCACNVEEITVYYRIGKNIAPHWEMTANMKDEVEIPMLTITHYYDCNTDNNSMRKGGLVLIIMAALITVALISLFCGGKGGGVACDIDFD